MTESSLDVAQLQALLELEWLDEKHRDIIKDTIKRMIILMPDMITILEKSIEDMKDE